MAGATLAVPSSISAAEANPAGFSMLTGSLSAQVNKVSFNDKKLQRSGDPIESSQWGFGLSPPPWGFSLAYYSSQTESGTYVSPVTDDTVATEVSIKEFRLTASRSFFDDTLALGVGLELIKAVRQQDDLASNAYAGSYRVGLLYKLPAHLIVGASFSPRVTVGPAGSPDPEIAIPGFNRNVVRPAQLGFGFGWMPNRFFKAAYSITFVGATANTALLADENVTTGANPTYVPRVGASYVLAEYENFKVEAAAGSYFEVSRLSDEGSRLHVTAGIEANPYFINTGAGFDLSSGYRNVMLSVGVDIVRTARALALIPKDNVPPLNGTFPRIDAVSADGLPDTLTHGEEKNFTPPSVIDVGKIVEDVPGNISKKVSGQPTTVEAKENQKNEKSKSDQKHKKPPVKKD